MIRRRPGRQECRRVVLHHAAAERLAELADDIERSGETAGAADRLGRGHELEGL